MTSVTPEVRAHPKRRCVDTAAPRAAYCTIGTLTPLSALDASGPGHADATPQRHTCSCAQPDPRRGVLLESNPSQGLGCGRSSTMSPDSACCACVSFLPDTNLEKKNIFGSRELSIRPTVPTYR